MSRYSFISFLLLLLLFLLLFIKSILLFSPECLDGAQKFLKPGGISIPSSYTSFIGPIQVSLVEPHPPTLVQRTKSG